MDLSVATQVGRSLGLRSVVSMRSRWVHRLPSHTWSMVLPNRSKQIHRVPNHNSKMVLSIVHFGPPPITVDTAVFEMWLGSLSEHRGLAIPWCDA